MNDKDEPVFLERKEGDTAHSLLSMVRKLEKGTWQLAPFQRDYVWDTAKARGFFDRCLLAARGQGVAPVGTLQTFQIVHEGSFSRNFLSDGSQRLRSCVRFLLRAEDYGTTAEIAEEVLEAVEMTVQHRHYNSFDEALKDFVLSNMGTYATPYEQTYGILVSDPRFPAYKQSLERIASEIELCLRRLGTAHKKDRESSHKLRRHNLVLLLRWLSADSPPNLKAANSTLKLEEFYNKRLPERIFIDTLRDRPIGTIERETEALCRFFQNLTEECFTIWGRLHPLEQENINPQLVRYIFEAAIAVRGRVSAVDRTRFLIALLEQSGGVASLPQIHNVRRYGLKMGQMGTLNKAAELVGLGGILGPQPARSTRGSPAPGRHRSHIEPFSINGDGETVLEPASWNMQRGAESMTSADLERLGKDGDDQ